LEIREQIRDQIFSLRKKYRHKLLILHHLGFNTSEWDIEEWENAIVEPVESFDVPMQWVLYLFKTKQKV